MRNLLFAFLLTCLIAACGRNESIEKTSQVVAKVNGDEITVHQINGELKRMQVPVANPQILARKILSSLVDRQLFVQEAVKLGLDRSPQVVQLVDTTRAQIYAQAYLARKVSALSPATELEVNQFISEHPEAFSQRKVFTTSDIIFANDLNKVNHAELQSVAHNTDELKEWLYKHQIGFEMAEENIPSESLPREALAMVGQIKVGDLLFMHDDIKVIARSVTHIAEAPLQEQQATLMATKIVNERKRQQLILNEVQRLKKLAKIEVLDSTLNPESGTKPGYHESSSTQVNHSADALDHGLKGL